MVHINFITNKNKEMVRIGNKTIGYVENNTFIKPVIGSKHQLRQPPAWGIDAGAFDERVKSRVSLFIILDRETGLEYQTSIETFNKHCFRFNRGFGDQYALSLKYWTRNGNGHKQPGFWEGGV